MGDRRVECGYRVGPILSKPKPNPVRMLGAQRSTAPSFIQGHGPSATSNGIKQRVFFGVWKPSELETLLILIQGLLVSGLKSVKGVFGRR